MTTVTETTARRNGTTRADARTAAERLGPEESVVLSAVDPLDIVHQA